MLVVFVLNYVLLQSFWRVIWPFSKIHFFFLDAAFLILRVFPKEILLLKKKFITCNFAPLKHWKWLSNVAPIT